MSTNIKRKLQQVQAEILVYELRELVCNQRKAEARQELREAEITMLRNTRRHLEGCAKAKGVGKLKENEAPAEVVINRRVIGRTATSHFTPSCRSLDRFKQKQRYHRPDAKRELIEAVTAQCV